MSGTMDSDSKSDIGEIFHYIFPGAFCQMKECCAPVARAPQLFVIIFFSIFFSAEKMQTIGSEREEAKAKKLAVRVQRQAKTI